MPPPDDRSLVDAGSEALRPIAAFQLAPPRTWAKIPVAPQDEDWPGEVAERLLDDDVLRQALATVLANLHLDLLGPDPHVMAAVWVPNRSRGYVEGMLTVDWIHPDPGARLDLPHYRGLFERTKRTNLEVLAQRLDDVELPAGPALRIRERTSRWSGRLFSRKQEVTERVGYVVFPPSSSDALQLTLETNTLSLGEALAQDADTMVATLNILLGTPDVAT
jgi:hypothetical protein